MGLLKTFGKWIKVKDQQAAEKLENSNIVDFAKQDITDMEKQLNQATANLGAIKGRTMSLQDNIKEKESMKSTKIANAKKLKELGVTDVTKIDLAKKEFEIATNVGKEIEAMQIALTQQEELYKIQKQNKDKLASDIASFKSDLSYMKTLDDVKKSNDSLTLVSSTGSESARSQFENRKTKLKEQFNASRAILEEQKSGSNEGHEEAVKKAIGNPDLDAEFAKL